MYVFRIFFGSFHGCVAMLCFCCLLLFLSPLVLSFLVLLLFLSFFVFCFGLILFVHIYIYVGCIQNYSFILLSIVSSTVLCVIVL